VTALAEVAGYVPPRRGADRVARAPELGLSPMRVKVFAAAEAALGATFPAMVFQH
jgi:hypothetical protein